MFVREYTRQMYQRDYKEAFLGDYNHGPLRQGEIDPNESHRIIEVLNRRAPKGVFFNPDLLEKELEGGACSAIALCVAKKAVELEAEPESFLLKIAETVRLLNAEALKGSQAAKSGRRRMRSIQAAFNTICVDKTQKVDDIAQEKIRAIAAYYSLGVQSSTEQIRVAGNDALQEDIERQLRALDEGVYLLRILHLEDNHKLEAKGHSVVYMKLPGIEAYFDAQLGLYDLTKSVGENDLLYQSLRSAQLRFQVDCFKFHKLEIRNDDE